MKMVDVGAKAPTARVAVATAFVRMNAAALKLIRSGRVPKGNVLEAARLAGIIAAKKTPDLIPLCHPISLAGVDVSARVARGGVRIQTEVKTVDRTGVEMEALLAAAASALTVYDMLKSTDRGMRIERVELLKKAGGRSGTWTRAARSRT